MRGRIVGAIACTAIVGSIACSKSAADVEGVWELDIDKSSESIANDPADLDADPRLQRFKGAARGPHIAPGDRGDIAKAREMELRAALREAAMQFEFKADSTLIMSVSKKGGGERETKEATTWKLEDGKVQVGSSGATNTFTFEGKMLKGRVLDGHPGRAYLRRR